MINRSLKLFVVLALCVGCLPLSWLATAQRAPIDFVRDIQPIFQTHCTGCHSAQKALAQLRLDSKPSAARVLKPGDSKASRLLQRVLGAGGEPRMPKGGVPLEPEQIELLRRWIDEGASWPEQTADRRSQTSDPLQHWAFVAPLRAALPRVRNKTWARNPIDAFVLARLEKEGLTPSPEADKVQLLRRLSLDLIGLPPTPEEVDAFLQDKSPRAYERQVERLLASPHYGERWGRLWLDGARYADSDGFEKDKPRNVWFYRDWVINALNHDLPYDQFVIEQIAGDLLPNPTQDQLVATGFLRNSMINEEGGVDPEQFRMEAMFDRMDALGKSVLGFTVNCAQCHNHKFDPLKQEEYYRLFAFLNNSHEGALVVYTPEEQMKRANILAQTREIEAKLQELKPDWQTAMDVWEARVKNDPQVMADWQIVQPEVNDISTEGARYLPQKDGSFLVGGYAPAKHRVKLALKTNVKNISAFRLELLTDPNLPLNGPGRSYKGSCTLTEFEVEAAASEKDKPARLKLARATADVNPPEQELEAKFNDKSGKRRVSGPVELAIDGKEETGWSIDAGPGSRNQSRKAVFNLAQPLANESGTTLSFYLSQKHGGWNNNDNEQQGIGRLRLSLTTAPDAVADPLPAGVRDILSIPRAQCGKAQLETVFSYWRTTVPEWASYNQQIAELWQQYPEGNSQLVMNERAELRDTFTLKRGDFLRPDKQIEPGVPAFLHPLPANAPKNRLTFAKWLVDRRSPTTARALVNRVWQAYFGTGLYATTEDLGRQGERPSHPELLDWLAVELMEPQPVGSWQLAVGSSRNSNSQSPKWSLKHIHRLIVTSATYRQSSKLTPQLLEKDPDNRLLARGARLRVEGEIVRDIALAASGLLNPAIGGRSVYPPSPEFLYLPPVSYGTKAWKEEKGAERYRRALYTFRFRSVPYPVLQAFDTPTGDVSCVRRAKSNTPLQALTTLNETLFLEAARALALKTLNEGGTTNAQRIEFAFRRLLARKPSAQETAALLALLNEQHARFASGALNPQAFALNEPEQSVTLPQGVTLAQLAAWTAVARALLNLDETITKG
ncbi:MAG: PSD1 domain-containing protein [Acidobacteria bacterium]|nr:PSD1 domain-containing protein [Acidobacteriota bacterium]